MSAIPERLRATVLELRGERKFVYKNLSNTTLSIDEKSWLCAEVSGDSPAFEDQLRTQRGLIRRYGLYENFFKKNYRHYLEYGTCRKGSGRPEIVDPHEWQEVATEICNRRKDIDEIPFSEVNRLINKAAIRSNRKVGRVDSNLILHGLSASAIREYLKRHRVQVRPTENSNAARVSSCLCPLMSYMWFLICYVFCGTLPATNKWNADATTYVFEPRLKNQKVCRLLDDDEIKVLGDNEDDIKIKRLQGGRRKSRSTTLPFAIKLMHMISAFGESSDLVLIIAVKNMQEYDWCVEEVNGLAYSSYIGAKGYIYFCKTRCGTKDMWKDYFTRIVFPTIEQSNECHKKTDYSGNLSRNFFSTDGEDIIISNAYDQDLASRFTNARIDYGRVGASTSGIHQAGDRQYTFKATKKEVKRIRHNNIDVSNHTLASNIHNAFSNLRSRYSSLSLTADKIDNYVDAILTLVQAWGVFTPSMARMGFQCCGQDCDPAENDNMSVSFEMIMKQCYTDIPLHDLEHMKASAPALCEIVKLRGTVTYDEFLAHGIKPGPTSIDRTKLSHVRHWSEIVNHKETIKRFEQEMYDKDPVNIQRKKQETTAALVVERHRKEEERARAVAVQKAERLVAKHAEAQRFAALSSHDQQQERTALKKRNAEALAQKRRNADYELQSAITLLAEKEDRENVQNNDLAPIDDNNTDMDESEV